MSHLAPYALGASALVMVLVLVLLARSS